MYRPVVTSTTFVPTTNVFVLTCIASFFRRAFQLPRLQVRTHAGKRTHRVHRIAGTLKKDSVVRELIRLLHRTRQGHAGQSPVTIGGGGSDSFTFCQTGCSARTGRAASTAATASACSGASASCSSSLVESTRRKSRDSLAPSRATGATHCGVCQLRPAMVALALASVCDCADVSSLRTTEAVRASSSRATSATDTING